MGTDDADFWRHFKVHLFFGLLCTCSSHRETKSTSGTISLPVESESAYLWCSYLELHRRGMSRGARVE